MDSLHSLVKKASHSSFYLWLLNVVLWRTVPFNRPHRLKITAINDNEVCMEAPYIRRNQNHIKGIHACLLATLCEYATGFSLLLQLSPKDYRIILKNIQMTYHYQAKGPVIARFSLDQKMIEEKILQPLTEADAVFHEFPIEIYDTKNQHICTGLINWQIKSWSKVKTKM